MRETLEEKHERLRPFTFGNALGGAGAGAALLGEGRQSVGLLAALHGGQTVYSSVPPNIPAAVKHSSDSLGPAPLCSARLSCHLKVPAESS